jgi:hypothetical protein
MQLAELANLGKIELEFEVVKGLKVKLHTLSMSEQDRALKSIPATLNDATGQFHHLQKALLVEATESVNGEKLSKTDLDKLYSDMQESLFQEIAAQYTTLLQSQNEVMNELKKK